LVTAKAVTLAASSRNSAGYQQLLAAVEQANPTGELAVITERCWPASTARPPPRRADTPIAA
jgi:hypothetical protein